MSWLEDYLEVFYPKSSGWIDGDTEFHSLCASAIPAGGSILEIGSGPPNVTSRFLSTLGTLTGLDVDPEIYTNNALDAAHVLSGETYPFGDDTFDACVSNSVIEHITDPDSHMKEVSRVLKPRGVYVFRTPNLFHYITVAAHLTPHWFHELVANRLRNLPAGSHAPYPTLYRMNTRSRIMRTARAAGLDVEQLHLIEKEPWYGRSSRVLFLGFMLYERVVNSHELFAGFRVNFQAVLRKKGAQNGMRSNVQA